MDINLSGKTAIVTGATGQLGRTIARTLAQCGADVAVHYLNNRAMAVQLTEEITGMGRKALAVQADVACKDSVDAMAEAVISALGAPQIVINCAVSQYQWTSVLEQDPQDYQDQFDTCVMHNVLMAKAFIPHMIKAQYGRFVGINTECVMQCLPNQSAYVAGKRGMDGIYRILAREVGMHGITVNQVAPGWTISDRERESGVKPSPDYTARVALNRRGTDQEIANAVAFLASDLAAFITGVYLPVCGGYVMPAI
jgi:3-oxoacyl-[acyl-carrier protein] reductase